jgi:hypothetical protein
MEQIPISLKLIDPNCKPGHARAYITKFQDCLILKSLKKALPLNFLPIICDSEEKWIKNLSGNSTYCCVNHFLFQRLGT